MEELEEIGRINIVRMTVVPKAIYRFNVKSYQITKSIFHYIRTKNFANNHNSLEKEKWS